MPTQLLLDELRQLEAELHHPGLKCSRERLEQLLHPDFHEVGRSGRPYSRQTVVEHLFSQAAPPSVQAEDYAVHPLAEDCALLTYRSAHRTAEGKLVDPALRSSVWRLTGKGWQLFYHQGTPAFVPEA
jgi:hypothetical protein